MKILLHATHPSMKTGYGRIGRFLANVLASIGTVCYLGYEANNLDTNPVTYGLNPSITIQYTTDPSDGFGFRELESLAETFKPDLIFISNDIIVVNQAVAYVNVINRPYKIITYLAIEYPYPNWVYTNTIYTSSDIVFFYNDYWRNSMVEYLGLHNGDRKMRTLRIPYSMPISQRPLNRRQDFIVLNTNRNVYRKLIDVTISAFIMFWKRTGCDPRVKLVLNCNETQDTAYNLRTIINTEVMRHFGNVVINVPIDNLGSNISEEKLLELYETSSVGINTAGGEGFGLTQMEGACNGIPQIVTNVGGLSDMFSKEEIETFPRCYTKIEPVVHTYIPFKTENIQGLFKISSAESFSDSLWKLYTDYPSVEERNMYRTTALTKYDTGRLAQLVTSGINELITSPVDTVQILINEFVNLKELIDLIIKYTYSERLRNIVFVFDETMSVRLDRSKIRMLLSRFVNGNFGYKDVNAVSKTVTKEEIKGFIL